MQHSLPKRGHAFPVPLRASTPSLDACILQVVVVEAAAFSVAAGLLARKGKGLEFPSPGTWICAHAVIDATNGTLKRPYTETPMSQLSNNARHNFLSNHFPAHEISSRATMSVPAPVDKRKNIEFHQFD